MNYAVPIAFGMCFFLAVTPVVGIRCYDADMYYTAYLLYGFEVMAFLCTWFCVCIGLWSMNSQ